MAGKSKLVKYSDDVEGPRWKPPKRAGPMQIFAELKILYWSGGFPGVGGLLYLSRLSRRYIAIVTESVL
jgi:hypothetical protein